MNGTKLVSGLAAALGAWLVAQNVGIGTSSPDSRLHVHNPSGTAATRVGRFENLNNAADNNGVLISTARAGTDAYILDAQSGTGAGLASRLYVRADGNVGIGTTSPGFGLDVEKGTAGTFAKFGNRHPLYVAADRPSIGFNLYYDNDLINGPFWRFGKGSTGHYGGVISVNPATGAMSVYTSNLGNAGNTATITERVTILQNGNVGIGLTNPAVRLEVAGRGLAHYGWETRVHVVNLTAADAATDLGTIINNLLNVYDCVWLRLPRNTTWTWNTQVTIRGGKSLVIQPVGWQWGEHYLNTGVVINITQPETYGNGHGGCLLGQTKDVSKLILGNGARATITGVRINVSICDNKPYHCWGGTRGIFALTGGGSEFSYGFFTNRAGESDTKLILSHVTIVTTEPVLAAGERSIGYVWFVGVPDPNNNNPNAGNPLGIFRATSCGSTPNTLQVVRTDNGWDPNSMECFVFVGMRPSWLKPNTSRAPGALTLSSAQGSGWVIYSE
jgi:hypothetical protein